MTKEQERIIKRWDDVMYYVSLEHLMLGNEFFSEVTKIPKCYRVENGVAIKWMVKEAKYWLSCYHEDGHVRGSELKYDDYDCWRKEEGRLKRLVAFLQKYDPSFIVVPKEAFPN